MTGYGRAKLSKDDREYQIEIKSVNHRYLDISVRIPKQLSYLEETIKKEIAKKVKRGKIDVFVTFENNSLEGKEIKINTELAKAYIDELFTEEEFKQESKIIESQIEIINSKMLENSQSEQLNFTVEDILLKRDMDFINKIKLPITYYAFNDNWELLDRQTKADIVMRYINDIDLEFKNNMYLIKQVNFRSTFYSDFEELYNKGYIDKRKELIYSFNGISTNTNVRYSEYLPIKEVMQHFYRLNEYYEVNFYKGTFYKETEKLDIGPLCKNEIPIRTFPLQKNNNGDKNWVAMGMFATKNSPNDIKVNIKDVFETIPNNVTEEDF